MDSIVVEYNKIIQGNVEQVNEGMLKNLAIGASIAAGVMLHQPDLNKASDTYQPVAIDYTPKKDVNSFEHLFSHIQKKYPHMSKKDAETVVTSAIKHADDKFPQAHHLVALAGIESTMKPKAVSPVNAVGLMQIKPHVWNIDKNELFSIDPSIKHSANILKQYHNSLGDSTSAIRAYNVGITNFRRGNLLPSQHRYETKFTNEVKSIQSHSPETKKK